MGGLPKPNKFVEKIHQNIAPGGVLHAAFEAAYDSQDDIEQLMAYTHWLLTQSYIILDMGEIPTKKVTPDTKQPNKDEVQEVPAQESFPRHTSQFPSVPTPPPQMSKKVCYFDISGITDNIFIRAPPNKTTRLDRKIL